MDTLYACMSMIGCYQWDGSQTANEWASDREAWKGHSTPQGQFTHHGKYYSGCENSCIMQLCKSEWSFLKSEKTNLTQTEALGF